MSRFKIASDVKVKELSRGMSVKLALALALSHHPDLLILDEPTSGLDPVAREEICEILQEFVSNEARSVLFSTHITSDLESIADYIVFILNGEIVYAGTKDDLLESYVIIKGGNSDLQQLDARTLIGLKTNDTGFEAVVHRNECPEKSDILIEPITLDELIVFFNRGGYHE